MVFEILRQNARNNLFPELISITRSTLALILMPPAFAIGCGWQTTLVTDR